MSRKNKSDYGLIILAFIIGVPVFLAIENPVVFWVIFMPIAVYFVTKLII